MKYTLLLFIMMPLYCFSQETIIGKWAKGTTALQFTSEGTVNIIYLTDPDTPVSKNLTLKYRLLNEDEITILELSYYRGEKLLKTEKNKYKIKNNKLYLPLTTETNGVETVIDYAAEYDKIE